MLNTAHGCCALEFALDLHLNSVMPRSHSGKGAVNIMANVLE